MKTTQFTVEGYGDFPFDMLRYDMCYPADSRDAGMLSNPETRKITLESKIVRGPTKARWESFGWKIVSFNGRLQ